MANEQSRDITKGIIQGKLQQLIEYLKPTVLNIVITIAFFIIGLVITRKIGIAVLFAVVTYLLVAFIVQPLFNGKLGNKIEFLTKKNKANVSSKIETNSKSIVLHKQNSTLIAISLLKVEWFANFVKLHSIWDFLQEEGIQIQDCREGCFFIIKKKAAIKKSKSLQEQAEKLIKDIERSILLTKKIVSVEFDDVDLNLVKGQENIKMILNFGLDPGKFNLYDDLSEDEIDRIRASSIEA
ncbi:MAG: hypothetical protein ACTSXA_11545 [Candidatus Heimdallarchaeota archaeon]